MTVEKLTWAPTAAELARLKRELSERGRELKRADQRALAAEGRFHALESTLPGVVYVVDAERGDVPVHVGGAIESLFGCSAQHYLEEPSRRWSWIHPDERERVRREFLDMLEGGGDFEAEYRLRPPHGQPRVIRDRACLVRSASVGGTYAQGVMIDVTEEARARRQAAQQGQDLLLVLDSVPALIVVKDHEDRALMVNASFRRALGLEEAEILGRTSRDLFGSVSPELLVAETRAWQTKECVRGIEQRIETRHGERYLVTDLIPQLDPKGTMLGLVAFSRDITGERALEAELRQAQKLEAIGRLAGGIAHDFNNLLTVLRSHAELALAVSDVPARARGSLEEIARTAASAESVTRQLLAFSRRQVLHPRVIELRELVVRTKSMLVPLIGARYTLEVSLPERECPVRADPSQLEQVLMNLVINARDAMEEGGVIEVAVRERSFEEPAPALDGLIEAGSYIECAVRDSGHGIPPEELERIFDPFFTTKAEGRGTGLGLATVFGVVSQSGGHLRVESEPGRGAIFRVLLPRSGEELLFEQDAKPAAHTRRGSERVLVVEDEPGILEVVTLGLEALGYNVVAATGGEEALVLARSEPGFDVLITDMVMPGLGGRELAAALRASQPALKVLLMSGYSEEMVELGGASEPGEGFIAKPFTPKELAAKLRLLLESERCPST